MFDSQSEDVKTIMVSGGFDPVHIGHIRMIREASKHGDVIVVPVDARRDPRCVFSHRAGGAADPADRATIWHPPGASGHGFPGHHAAGLHYPARWP